LSALPLLARPVEPLPHTREGDCEPATSRMDQQSSARWLETLKAESRAKEKWNSKYLTAEQQAAEAAEDRQYEAELAASSTDQRRHVSERDAMEMRLAFLDNIPEPEEPPKELPQYEIMRQKVAAEVARTRQRSHRFTGDLSIDGMLKDIGPGLWISINPAYAPLKFSSSQHRVHAFDKKKGWGDRVDKQHHLKQDAFMAHADKCLQLGEKPFVSGGMKLSKSG